jgi:hypothetical protein
VPYFGIFVVWVVAATDTREATGRVGREVGVDETLGHPVAVSAAVGVDDDVETVGGQRVVLTRETQG